MNNLETGLRNARKSRDTRRMNGRVPTASDVVLDALEGLPEADWEQTVREWARYVGGSFLYSVRAVVALGWLGRLEPKLVSDLAKEPK